MSDLVRDFFTDKEVKGLTTWFERDAFDPEEQEPAYYRAALDETLHEMRSDPKTIQKSTKDNFIRLQITALGGDGKDMFISKSLLEDRSKLRPTLLTSFL